MSTTTKPPKTKTGFYVKRTRIDDSSVATAVGFRVDQTGEVRFSKAFTKIEGAQREADAWISTGSWSAIVVDAAGKPVTAGVC